MKLSVEKINNSFIPNLEIYHSIYAPLFQREEQREQAQKYMQNLMGKAANKAVETMVLETEDPSYGAIRAQQRFLSNSPWDDQAILSRHWLEVNHDLGEEEGVLIVDGSDFAKQGDNSVGVKRQWCGELGKTANCQAGVFLGYASSRGYTLLDRRLYMPQEWLEEDWPYVAQFMVERGVSLFDVRKDAEYFPPKGLSYRFDDDPGRYTIE